MRGKRSELLRRTTRGAVGVAVALLVWWAASAFFVGGGGGRIPSPWQVLDAGARLAASSIFWEQAWVTIFRGTVGLVVALVISIVLAFLIARSRVMNAALEPLVSILYPVPRIALFPVALIALGIGAASQITLVAIECMFPLTVALYAGLRGIDKNVVWLARNLDVGALRLAGILLRTALPALFTGLRIAAPVMLTITVATQMFTGSSDGLGYLIQVSASRLQTAQIFAIAILIGLFGYLIDRIIVALETVFSRHQRATVV